MTTTTAAAAKTAAALNDDHRRDDSSRLEESLLLERKTSGTSQYAEIVVNGKTGNRSIPLFSAVPVCQGLD
jgi:hypothetical protein